MSESASIPASAAVTQLERLRIIMGRLRTECPWDAKQTHESLLNHLIEEACEVVDAVEIGSAEDLREELGDLLLQVYFHAEIAAEEGSFDLEDVAKGISEKLIRRHPHVFAGAEVPSDMRKTWEQAKRAEKGRSSALEGIAESMSSLARAQKVVSRLRSHQVPVRIAEEPISADEVGRQILQLVERAQISGVDADAATRNALRQLEARVVAAETTKSVED